LFVGGYHTGYGDVELLLRQVRTLPFKSSDANVDDAYSELIKRGLSVGEELASQITNTTPSVDPRKAPHVRAIYVLGDTAIFVLADILDCNVEAFVPSQVVANIQDVGVAAYFGYVQTPSGRADVKARALQVLRTKAKKLKWH
jgi:hypothetical protein